MGQIDVLYMTRVQKERFPTQADYDAVKDVFKITPETMAMVRLYVVYIWKVDGFGMLVWSALNVHGRMVVFVQSVATSLGAESSNTPSPHPTPTTPGQGHARADAPAATRGGDQRGGGRRPTRCLLPPDGERDVRAHGPPLARAGGVGVRLSWGARSIGVNECGS